MRGPLVFLVLLLPVGAGSEPRVSGTFLDTPAQRAAEDLARQANVSVRIQPDSTGPVSGRLQDVPFTDALRMLFGTSWRRIDERTYEIRPDPPEDRSDPSVSDEASLAKMVASCDLKGARELLVHRPDLLRKRQGGETALLRAARSGLTEMVQLLLDAGADVQEQDARGHSSMWLAAAGSCPSTLKLLFARGARPQWVDPRAEQLMFAVSNLEILDMLLAHGGNLSVRDATGATLLHLPNSMGGRPDRVDTARLAYLSGLVQRGAPVNGRTKAGGTPLHSAASWSGYKTSREYMRVLIAGGADVDARDNRGTTPLYVAQDPEAMAMLIAHGARVDLQDETGETPLHAAVGRDSSECVRILLDHGARTERTDKRGATPLLLACIYGRVATLRLLLEHGAAVDAAGPDGRTALHEAAERLDLESARMLLAHRASPLARTRDGLTPADLATLRRPKDCGEMVRLLEMGRAAR